MLRVLLFKLPLNVFMYTVAFIQPLLEEYIFPLVKDNVETDYIKPDGNIPEIPAITMSKI